MSLTHRLALVRSGGDGGFHLPDKLPLLLEARLFLEPGGRRPRSTPLERRRKNDAVEPLKTSQRRVARDPHFLGDLGERKSVLFQLQQFGVEPISPRQHRQLPQASVDAERADLPGKCQPPCGMARSVTAGAELYRASPGTRNQFIPDGFWCEGSGKAVYLKRQKSIGRKRMIPAR